jgi:signal transduction histidine kinase/CheY-like chemotaxis protein
MPKNVSTLTRENPELTTVSPRKDNSLKETEPSLSARIDVLLSKAADLIGHAMNLDALVFFDAVETGTLHMESRPSSDFTNKAFPPPNDKKTSPPAQALAEYPDHASAASEMSRQPSQSLIRQLTAAYPLGHIFTIDEYGILEEGVQQAKPRLGADDTSNIYDECEELFNCIPKARYAIFLPLWHYQRESSYLNCLAWVSDPGKTLEANDINSLTAFGNSLMAEIFRLEAATSTQQKSNFVSSVSHELRSPLHGILATVELMQEQPLDPHLLSMTQMIESCSYTLLDTFDHLLEFSKINSSRKGKEFATPAKSNVVSAPAPKLAIDLSSAVEEVLQAVSLGHSSVSQMDLALKKEHQDPLASRLEHLPLPVLITTHIDYNHTWTSRMDPGIWKRILLNIFSNALQFTVSGHIDVTLEMIEGTDVDPRCISLIVADSGVGMSREFLKYHLFTPFMQEDSLVSGTGLGLHIVKNLVESLHGNISVESRQHEGTRITINIPFDGEPEKSGQTNAVGSLAPYEKTLNLTIGLINIASQKTPTCQTAPHIETPPKLLQRCLRNICETSLGMTVVDNLPLNELLDKDVVLLDTHSLFSTEVLELQQHFPEVMSAMASRPFIVLGSTTAGVEQFFRDRGATFISSPITRKSLRDAITNALNRDVHAEAPSSLTLGVDGQGLSRQLDPPSPRSSSTEPGATIARNKSVDLQIRNIPSIADTSTKNDSSLTLAQQQSRLSQPPSTPASNAPLPPPTYRFKHLLLVDDNPINLKLLAAFARRTGLSYATAYDGAEAVRLYKKAATEGETPFDCIFMDISMPTMDGFQATSAIRHLENEQRKARDELGESRAENGDEGCKIMGGSSLIVALTGLGSEEARAMARDSGFDLFLVKPVKFRDLEPLLRV